MNSFKTSKFKKGDKVICVGNTAAEDVEDFIKSLTKYNDAVINGSIEVVGGIDEAISILNNAPQDSNCYDIMYKRHGYLESFFWVDHNITVKLSDLKQAIGKIK